LARERDAKRRAATRIVRLVLQARQARAQNDFRAQKDLTRRRRLRKILES
jgi:hypothetical protein